eukprot:5104628-Prymnesium_polylepis.1
MAGICERPGAQCVRCKSGCMSRVSLVCGGSISGAYELTHPIATTRPRIRAPRPPLPPLRYNTHRPH